VRGAILYDPSLWAATQRNLHPKTAQSYERTIAESFPHVIGVVVTCGEFSRMIEKSIIVQGRIDDFQIRDLRPGPAGEVRSFIQLTLDENGISRVETVK
jgi:hypothetical protein